MRRAIAFRMPVSCTTSTSPVAAGCIDRADAGSGAAFSARSTSSATIRPSGPVPWIEARSIPRSRAQSAGQRRSLHAAAVLAPQRVGRLRSRLRLEPGGGLRRGLRLRLRDLLPGFADDRDRLADLDLLPRPRGS